MKENEVVIQKFLDVVDSLAKKESRNTYLKFLN